MSDTTKLSKKPEALIKRRPLMGAGALSDEFLAIAHNVETALRDAGGVPGRDYKLLDLFQLAQPIVVALMEKGEISGWAYPAETVAPDKG